MRELILKMTMSLDGFVSDSDGRNGWMFGNDAEAQAWNAGVIAQAGLHIMGSRTFRDMAAWWPRAPDPLFAAPMNRIPKAVFSRQGTPIVSGLSADTPDAQSWAGAHVASGALADEIAQLKAQDGQPIIAHGGVGFARSLLAAGLIDRLILLVAPIALGRGKALFCELAAPLPLRLLEAKVFPSGAAALTYAPG